MSDEIIVLFIEDNKDDYILVSEVLEKDKSTRFSVYNAETLNDAKEWLKENAADVIFLDLNLPDSNGLATLEDIKYAAEKKPIIVISGVDDREQEIEAMKKGAQDYIIKSNYKTTNLNRTIFYAMERKKLELVLKKANEDLKNVNEMKNSFVSMVSHELRTPLTSIKGFTTFLSKGVAGKVNVQQIEFLDIIRNNTDRLLKLIDELLDFSRIEAGKFSVERQICEIVELVKKCVLEVGPMALKKGIDISFESKHEIINISVDSLRMSQAIINIIGNSIKYSLENTKMTISVDKIKAEKLKVPEYVTTNCLPGKECLLVTIKDQGLGIDKENIERIFGKFFQEDDINTRRGEGVGLGLNIAKSIIDAHHGAIWAESEGKNKGSSFNILLPFETTGGECYRLMNCKIFSRLMDSSDKTFYIKRFCKGQFEECERIKHIRNGEIPSDVLMPDGKVIQKENVK